MTQFALAWILSNKTITALLSGTTTLEQLEENLSAIDIQLSQEELKACDEVWYELFRPPRQHYAWTLEELAKMRGNS